MQLMVGWMVKEGRRQCDNRAWRETAWCRIGGDVQRLD
ncbi:hypothetical protein EPIB2_1061 [Tritonibacter mobilis]|nr:hypothetical protein EPIB2_1061 [Tritonibacter mobilis]